MMWLPQFLKNAVAGHCCLSAEDLEESMDTDIQMSTLHNYITSTAFGVPRITVSAGFDAFQQPSRTTLDMIYHSAASNTDTQPVTIIVERKGTKTAIPFDHPHLGYLPQLQLIRLDTSTKPFHGQTAIARLTRNEHSFISRTLLAAISTDLKVQRLTDGMLKGLKATIPVIDAHFESLVPLRANWTDQVLGYVALNWRQLTYHGMLRPKGRRRPETTTFFVLDSHKELELPGVHVLLGKTYNYGLNVSDNNFLVKPQTAVSVAEAEREWALFDSTARGFSGLGAAVHLETDALNYEAMWNGNYWW